MDIVNRHPHDILRLEKSDPRQAQALWHSLSPEQRLSQVLTLTDPREQMRLILLARDSRYLAQSLSNDNFVRLVLDIGPEDCLEMIELSSQEQLTHLLDLTAWRREELDPGRYEAWLPIIMEAGPQRLKEWLESVDLEVLTLLGRYWFTVWKYLPSQEEQEPPDDLPEFTLDGVYWLEFHHPDESSLIAQTLVVLKSEVPEKYMRLMEAMRWESGSDLNEYARRWRQGRLQDQGFPTREEALGLWAVPYPGESAWQDKPPKYPGSNSYQESGLSQWWRLMPAHELLPLSLAGLSAPERENLRQELAFIANCGVVALDADPASGKAVRQAAAESLGLVNLGLSLLLEKEDSSAWPAPARAAAILSRLPLTVVARQGAAALRELNKQAWELVHKGWLKGMPTGFNLLDFPLDRWLAGLLFKLPRFYDEKGTPEFRAFYSGQEIKQAKAALAEASFWGPLLFDLMGLKRLEVLQMLTAPGWPEDPMDRKLSHLLATCWVRQSMGYCGLAPLKLEDLPRAIKVGQTQLAGDWRAQVLASVARLPRAQALLAGRMLNQVLDNLQLELKNIYSGSEFASAPSLEVLAQLLPFISET